MFPANALSQNETDNLSVTHDVLRSSGTSLSASIRNIAGTVGMMCTTLVSTLPTVRASDIISDIITDTSNSSSQDSSLSSYDEARLEYAESEAITLFAQSTKKGHPESTLAQWSIFLPPTGGTLTLLYDVEIGTASQGGCTTGSAPIWGVSQGFSKTDFDMQAILRYGTQTDGGNGHGHDDHGNGLGIGHIVHGNGNGNGHDEETMTTIAIVTTPVQHNDNQADIARAESFFTNQRNNSVTLSIAPGSEIIDFGLDFSVSNCGGAVRLSNVRYIFTSIQNVPEPSAAILGSVGALLFMYRGRRIPKKTSSNTQNSSQ